MSREIPHILFLFSDTGGGHRSATEAILEPLQRDFAGRVTFEMVDFLQDHYPWPYRKFPEWYNDMVRFPRVYGAVWHGLNGRRRTPFVIGTHRAHPTLSKKHNDMISRSGADLVVATHWAAVNPLIWTPRGDRPPVGVVVTDLVTVHSSWVHEKVEFAIVPTAAAAQKAIGNGIAAENVHEIGLPIASKFHAPSASVADIRAAHGWAQEKPVVLLMGGGDGMGPLAENARAIAQSGLDVSLVIICGRNDALKAELEGQAWAIPTHIYGFVRTIPDFMHAADILVTKAGPSSIVEAIHCDLPVILYSRIRGQEDGNVSWVVDAGAGQWSPQPRKVVQALHRWLDDPAALDRARLACRQLARPQAADEIATLLVQKAEAAVAASHLTVRNGR